MQNLNFGRIGRVWQVGRAKKPTKKPKGRQKKRKRIKQKNSTKSYQTGFKTELANSQL